MHRTLRLGLAAAATAALAVSSFAFAVQPVSPMGEHVVDAGAPTDYVALAGELSQPDYPDTIVESHQLPIGGGETLYVEITRPDPAVYGELVLPVVMEASPYHGTTASRTGTRIFPDPVDESGNAIGLTGYFAPRGYAVAMVDLRGTGRSSGCLDHLGPNDAADLKVAIEWAASQTWSNGRVGMTGHSYVGATQMAAAELRPEGLATIVPSAGLASMYDHQFQAGVPYNLQYVGPMVAYEALAIDRHLPSFVPSALGDQTGDNFGNDPEDFGCGLQSSAALSGPGQLTGQYELWHAQRDHSEAATNIDIPIFMIHGVNDNAARIPAAEWFFGERFDRGQDKVWIGQWDHGSTNGRCGNESGQRTLHPTCRFDQFQLAVHAWFDKHLQGMDVNTGPAVEAFLNPPKNNLNVATVINPESFDAPVLTATSWSRVAGPQRWFVDAATNSLTTTAPTAVSDESFIVTAQGGLVVSSGSLEFTSEPLTTDTVLLGLPQLDLRVSTTSPSVDLVITLHNEDPFGTRTPITTCAIDPVLRFGVTTVAPVIPGEVMRLQPQCFTAAHVIAAGHSLVLEVGGQGPHHFELGGGGIVTLHTGPGMGGFELPVVRDAVLHPDVPLRAG
ncbi:MAG: putative acyl esterase [Nitriliruptoraceae bacterium]|jgi:predicted acyl esterase